MKKRILSFLLCLTLLMGYLPVAAQAEPSLNRVADPSTMDSWKQFFTPEPLNTQNAGGVWTDKSVFTDAAAFTGITQREQNSFLVALSAMASNMTVTGMANVPTDTMMILDLSSSMYDGSRRTTTTVQTMLTSVNDSITRLQNLNANNRVGVVVYYGGVDRNQSDASNSMVLLPLDRYSGTTQYLKANINSGRLISVAVNSGVKNAAGKTMPQTTRTVTDVAGTYAQLGILDAMNQLLNADTVVPATAAYQPGAARTPVFIFMSDGEPTAATHNYTKKVAAGMGNNTVSIRSANETDFVTQLTAAYAKEKVDAHYAQTDALFYTLSLGTSVSLAVMDPANHTTATIDGYWKKLLSDGSVKITVYNSPNAWGAPTVKQTYTVSTSSVNGSTFPGSVTTRNYVDKTFTATTAGGLTDAFGNIVNHINLVSKYTPTLTSGDADLSGYISFVDKVGKYMTVTDIKGILINNTLFSGGELAKNFVPGGGNLGTYENPTRLGDEMVGAVRARLGLDSADAARTLIGLAYEHGQLSYTSPTEYSNYIGWYANAAGEFLGFWHEGIQTMPQPTGNVATDPAFIIKSYGYLGAVDESHGVAASDMMYATVQIRENIASGEQSVVFAVPAALIPLITYEVKLDINGKMSDLTTTGAQHPIRLVYEVALQKHINEQTLLDTVSSEYLAANTNADGSVNFYTNQYEADNTTGYGKVNTYSYFNPSRQNDKYYYLEDAPVYTDTNGTLYRGNTQPDGTFYRNYTVYTENGAVTQYRRLSDAALETAKQASDGSWYIGAGNVHVNLEGYTVPKSQNPTGTLTDTNIPFVDAHNHSVGDLGYRFIVGATLGNNGRISLIPETGIALRKYLAEGTEDTDIPFSFVISGNQADDGSYTATLVQENGTQTETAVTFENGKATVTLAANQTLYIGGLTANAQYTVTEIQTEDYIPQADSHTVTLTPGQMADVTFINAARGSGNLTISKEVAHTLGSDYIIPENKAFAIHVLLEGVGVGNQTFQAVHSGGGLTAITTDREGAFTVTLRHNEQIQILGLPEGTKASVTEPTPGEGFTVSYEENGSSGDGKVVIPKGAADVAVINTYTPAKVSPVNVAVQGRKNLITDAADWNGAEFGFALQRWTQNGWQTIDTATANEANPTFAFSMANEVFDHPGTYHYQVLETHGGETLSGITYDATLHTFNILVTDRDMDGQLEIHEVLSAHTGNAFEINGQGDWQIDISFTNHYHATGCNLVLDVLKRLENTANSPLVSPAGFRFGLYEGDRLVGVSELSNGVGEARFILNYQLADEGTHTYTLKEIIPETPIPGMTYDETAYTVVVEVIDNADGTMTAALVSIDGETDYETPVFTNIYDPVDTTLAIDFVSKTLQGRNPENGEFTFQLRGNGTLLNGTNDVQGKVTFSDVLHFDRVGTFRYELLETSPEGNGITTDKAVYTILVNVIDRNGALEADYEILNLVGKDVVFVNTYRAEPISYTIRGNKTLLGRVLLNEEFTFVLTRDASTWEAKNFTDGSFAFEELTFTEAGTYHYTVHEKPISGADFGILFDEAIYAISITVKDNLEGRLYVSDVTITTGGKEVEDITFTNRYEPKPTSAQLGGNKELIGKVLNEGDFGFNLYEADENWNEIRWLEYQENDGSGNFAFSAMDYETPGSRYYLVKEDKGGQTIDGITYDDTVYRVEIAVTDDLRGQLHAETFLYNQEGIPQEAVLFRNLYTVTGEVTVTLAGTKTLQGRELSDGEFTFELHETDDSFTVSHAPIQTAANCGTQFELTLTYLPEDIGSVRYYVITEHNAGQRIDGITYSSAKYYVTVEILDDGIGGIQTITTVTDGTNSVNSADFVNVYTPDAIEPVISGTKTLIGRNLTEGEFTFELYETDENGIPISEAITATHDIGGSFSFPALRFEEAQLRYYLVKEVHSGETIDDVTYDDTVYHIVIDVTDNGLGQLAYTVDIRTDEGTAAEEITFENSYVTPPTEPTEPPTEPEDTDPTQPPTEPEDTEPTQPPTEPEDTEPTELPTVPEDTEPVEPSPETGDMGIRVWLVLMLISCGAILTMAVLGKKKSPA